jgi:NitT/TauT family transport system permease protein
MSEQTATPVVDRAAGSQLDVGRWLSAVAPPLGAFVVVVVVWEALVNILAIPAYFIPAPHRIAEVLVTDFSSLCFHAGITLIEAVAGFVIGSALGGLLGIIFAYSPVISRAVLPYAVAANTIPVVAIAPIIILWFGNDIESKIVVTAFLSFFPLSINMMKGLKSYDPLVAELFHVCAASPWQRFWRMRIPFALPYVFVGLKLNVTFAVIGAIVAEFVQADKGLGFVIMTTYRLLNMPKLWAAMFISSVIGILFYGAIALAERVSIPWHSSMREEA